MVEMLKISVGVRATVVIKIADFVECGRVVVVSSHLQEVCSGMHRVEYEYRCVRGYGCQ